MLDFKMRRERPRVESFVKDKDKRGLLCERIHDYYTRYNQDRATEIDMRLQRYAKYRMWTEGKNWPWEDATDAAIPDMMTASMRLQDTLHNAVMSQRPAVRSKALKKHDAEKEETVDDLIDFQVFVEQPGEEIVGQLAHDFVNEGFYTAYIPWVEEKRNVVDLFVLPAIPEGVPPMSYFQQYLEGKFDKGVELMPSADGWDWEIKTEERKKGDKASFFTREDGEVEVEIHREVIRYQGPRVIPKDVQHVLHQARCENLQIPGPSNPNGAPVVMLVDFPTIDEIKRLSRGKHPYYDLLQKEDREKLGLQTLSTSHQEREEQKDTMQGHIDQRPTPPKTAESHGRLTRLMVFDCYDVDGDGVDEDVIFWFLLEPKVLLRARYLTQMFPAKSPTRPLAEGHLFPVPGRRYSIGLLEMMEGLHDLTKQFFDQGGDAGTIANAPFGFYRASSNMRPEVIRMWPGEMYPLNDPQKDVHFPTLGNQNQAFTFNMVALLQQMEERLTTIGELQLGRVPQGKASALRTVQGMQTIMSQGDARPERVLRRFFIGLTQAWRIIHSLNQAFLPKKKQIRITGNVDPGKDPYRTVEADDVRGDYMFDFSANALNTSKEALQMALQQMLGTYVSELNIMLGIMTPDGAYRLQRDWGKALGPDPDKYLTPPSPTAMQAPIFAEEAISMMMDGQMPAGSPAEGAEMHLQKLMQFMQADEFGLMSQESVVGLFKPYLEQTARTAMMERQQQALLAAAQQFGQNAQQPGKSGPPALAGPGGAQAQPPIQGAELLDESLPTAGGGGNAGRP